MVAVHIALTWALGIVYGTGHFLMFFSEEEEEEEKEEVEEEDEKEEK